MYRQKSLEHGFFRIYYKKFYITVFVQYVYIYFPISVQNE